MNRRINLVFLIIIGSLLSEPFKIEKYFKNDIEHIINIEVKNNRLYSEDFDFIANPSIDHIRHFYPSSESDRNSIVLNGIFRYYDDYGSIERDEYYKNGLRDSIWTYYYNDGSVQKRAHYSEGRLNGKYIKYYKDGNILEERNYKDDKLNGAWTWFYNNGSIWKIEKYKLGVKSGEWFYYYRNVGSNIFLRIIDKIKSSLFGHSKIKWKKSFKFGNKHGHFLEYSKNGDIISQEKYFYNHLINPKEYDSDGKLLNGEVVQYHTNGKIRSVSEYINGVVKHRISYGWHYNMPDHKRSESYFKDGIVNGISSFFNNEGNITSQFNYDYGTITWSKIYDDNGKLLIYNHGYINGRETIRETYFTNGSLKELRHYNHFGNIDGDYIEYHINGNIKLKGQYLNNEKYGLWYSYDENGSIIEENNFLVKKSDNFIPKTVVLSQGKYDKKNFQDGEWKFFDKNNNLILIGSYNSGKKEGRWIKYSLKGHIKSRYNFKNDKKHGIYEEFSNDLKTL